MQTAKLSFSSQLQLKFGVILVSLAAMSWVTVAHTHGATRAWMLGVSLVVLARAAFAVYSVWQQLRTAFSLPAAAARKIAAGDLATKVEMGDADDTNELMHAISDLHKRMLEVVQEVRSRTNAVVTSSAQLGRDNDSLRTRSELQLESLQKTTVAMDQLNVSVQQNSEQTQRADELVTSASQQARDGGAAMEQVVQTMGSIKDSSRKIVDIIALIDSIAFQTNILALNAAVEAARAGDHGRGFAVVAGEVRTLARRSATAAKEIKSLIHESVQTVGEGSKLVDDAGKTMAEIVTSVTALTDIIRSISAVSSEQRTGLDTVNNEIREVRRINRANNNMFAESILAAKMLNDHAVTLFRLMSNFNVGIRETGTVEEAVAMLKRGVEFAQTHGKEALIEDINKLSAGQFIERDIYLFVIDPNTYEFIAHGVNARLLKYDCRKVKDKDGVSYLGQLIDFAKERGEGSIEYESAHPITNETLPKIGFAQRVGDIVIASGAYK
jgi:methyl-accepting chemotaxis protein